MISKRTRNNIIIASISVIIVIIIAVLVYLYFTTDMFKSNEVLFSKYLGKAAQNIETLAQDTEGDQYNALLENNKYTSNTEITVDYLNNIGTTDENTRNVINNLKLIINGQTDKLSGTAYKDFLLKRDDENITEVEYLKSDDRYGLRFSDLFNQYLVIRNEDIKKIAGKLGLDVTNIPNQIEEINLRENFKLTNEEIENINETYTDVITGDYSKDKFSSLKKSSTTVKDQTYEVNAYTLTLTKEELNNVYIAILEKLKEDDTLLSKIDALDEVLNPKTEETDEEEQNETNQQTNEAQGQNSENQTNENGEQTSENQENQNEEQSEESESTETENQEEVEAPKTIKEQIIEKIDSKITEIKNTNIGTDETKITVYENEGNTIKTTIETPEYKVNIETISNGEGTYIKYFKEIYGIDENSDEIIIEKRANSFNINREEKLGQNIKQTSFTQERTIEDGKQNTNTTFVYDMGRNKIQINMADKKEVLNEFKETNEFTNSNAVVLNSLNDEQFENIKNILNDRLIERLQTLSEQVNYGEVFRILNELGILPEQITIENIVTLTRSEISKFNAEFEIYKGQKVNVNAVENLLKIAKENLETVEVLSEDSIKLNIAKGTKNEELANKVSEIINNDENKSKEYSIEYEYDEETNIIKAIIIKILERQ